MDDLSFELDVIELTEGCAEACSHCSESPVTLERHVHKSTLQRGIERLCALEEAIGQQVFARFWYPFPASDPFSHRELFSICEAIWKARSIKCYLLSLGWGERGKDAAKAFAERSESLFRFGLTISNFSQLAERNPDRHRDRLAASLLGIRPLWDSIAEDDRPLIFLSPQFVDHIDADSPYSIEGVQELAQDVAARAGFRLADWEDEGRVFWRPIVGLGRAKTKIGVTSTRRTPITAEIPEPEISRFPERPNSAMLTLDGEVALYPAPRGILGRARQEWRAITWKDVAQGGGF